MNSFTTFYPHEAKVRKIWDNHNILDINTDFALQVETNDRTTIFIHAKRAELEIIYKALDDFFADIHKAEKAEVEAERYAEAMHDQMLSEQASLS